MKRTRAERSESRAALVVAAKALLGSSAVRRIRESAAAVDVEQSIASLELAQRTRLPVFLDSKMHPRWVLEQGPVEHRVLLVTIPKAGTHMMAKMLPRFGVADCGVHVLWDTVVDHRFAPELLQRHHPSFQARTIDLVDSVRLIAPGQFAYGHIGLRDASIRTAFAGFKVVMMYRNLRDVYVSLVRYFREIRHDVPAVNRASVFLEDLASLVEWDLDEEGPRRLIGFRAVCAWRHEPNVLALRYEDVVGDLGRERQMEAMHGLRAFLGSSVNDVDLADILNTVIGQPTLTKTDRRTVASESWSDEAERRYRRIGFPDLNRELGYDEPG